MANYNDNEERLLESLDAAVAALGGQEGGGNYSGVYSFFWKKVFEKLDAIIAALEAGGGGGGGGGTTNYNALSNKPQIEGVTLQGNKSAADLGLAKTSAITEWVLEQLAAYQEKLTAEQLAAANSGITSASLSALQTAITALNDFKNRSQGFAPLAHTHQIDDISAFIPGQYSTDWPDYSLNLAPRDWIRRMLSAGRRQFVFQAQYTPGFTTAYWVQFDAISNRMEFEIYPLEASDSADPMPYYMKFRYGGAGKIQDLVQGGSLWQGTPQWFKNSLWIPLPAGAQPLITISIGMDVQITLVTANPGRTECLIKPFP